MEVLTEAKLKKQNKNKNGNRKTNSQVRPKRGQG